MTLPEFLLARIAEDERHAHKLAETDPRPVLSLASTVNHPERILLECEAKRAIVRDLITFRRAGESNASEGLPAVLTMAGIIKGYERAVATLALPYADHDDYDDTWRP